MFPSSLESSHSNSHVPPRFQVQQYVWAKLPSSPPWPALVMPSISIEAVPLPKKTDNVDNYYWVYFLGSQNYSWVKADAVKPYEPFREKYVSLHKKAPFKEAVAEMDRHVQLRNLVPTYVVENIVPFRGGAKKKSPRPKSSLSNHINDENKTPRGRPKSSLDICIDEDGGDGSKKKKRPRSRLSNQADEDTGTKNSTKRPRSRLSNYVVEDWGYVSEKNSSSRPNSRLGNHEHTKRPRSKLADSKKSSATPRPSKRERSSSVVSSGYNSLGPDSDQPKRRRKSTVRPPVPLDSPSNNEDEEEEDMSYVPFPVPDPEWCLPLDTQNIRATDKWIGVLGLGLIGHHVVTNLLHSGHRVNIWNRTASKRERLEQEFRASMGKSLFGYTSIHKLLRKSDIIFVCIAGYDICKEFVQENFGVNDTDDTVLEGKSVVILTNMDPESSKNIRDMVVEKGAKYLEAQIQWGGLALEERLLLFAAGDKELFTACQSCFKAISTYCIYLGRTGYACMVMLIFQLVKGVLLASLAECLYMVRRFGINLPDFVDILMTTSMSNDFIRSKSLKMVEEAFRDVEQSMSNMQTDMKMGLALSDMAKQPMSVTAVANELYKQCCHLGYGKWDAAIVYMRNFH